MKPNPGDPSRLEAETSVPKICAASEIVTTLIRELRKRPTIPVIRNGKRSAYAVTSAISDKHVHERHGEKQLIGINSPTLGLPGSVRLSRIHFARHCCATVLVSALSIRQSSFFKIVHRWFEERRDESRLFDVQYVVLRPQVCQHNLFVVERPFSNMLGKLILQ